MSEFVYYNPTAEELYSGYKQQCHALEVIKQTLPPANEAVTAMINEMDAKIDNANMAMDKRQELLTKLAGLKNISMIDRVRLQEIDIVIAEHTLESYLITARSVLKYKINEWYQVALDEYKFKGSST